jgi:GGDEF domain-containing protein
VLRAVADRLAAALPEGSLVGRTGSDEFTADADGLLREAQSRMRARKEAGRG